MPVSRLVSLSVVAALAVSSTIGCSDPDACAAIDIGDTECQPLYQPTFDNVFQNTLLPSCGVAGVACHAPEGAAGGLIFADVEQSYQQLVGDQMAGANPRIDLDNIGCGALLSRLSSSDASYQMPPSAPLADAELCAIQQWVVAGAPR